MTKDILKRLILEQRERLEQGGAGIEREVLGDVGKDELPHIKVISGLRRSGKSTLLKQLMIKHEGDFYYFNFENEQLINFMAQDFNDLYEAFLEIEGEKKVFFFDEIQNVPHWELFVRRMYDAGFKFYITGSNASLLSKELGTRLTGRHLNYTLYPFSFREFLKFNEQDFKPKDLLLSEKSIALKRQFNKYLKTGGMPEFLLYENDEVLKRVYDDILYRDIATRYKIRDSKSLRELSYYFIGNITSLFSYNRLEKILALKTSNTVKDYIDHLENSYLFFTLRKYSSSLSKQMRAPQKIYCIDNGMVQAVSFQFSRNQGKFLENLVFLELKRQGRELYYYKTDKGLEVDFLIREKNQHKQLIQVAWSMSDPKTYAREVDALKAAMRELSVKSGLILTDDHDEELKTDNITIKPAYKWLLEI